MLKKKKLGQFSKELKNFSPKNLSLSSQKYEFGIPDLGPGVKKAPDPGSQIPGPDPQNCSLHYETLCKKIKRVFYFYY
jgi:hypothetical protein